jgi:2-oxoglutarate ferredoxin oxidoreductase subunit alpha
MVEALGLAGITETPVVIYNAQRPGPATGLPTRQEQADLPFTLYASQGEFPRFVLAPGTIEEAFFAGWHSLNLADKYQTPALVLSDHYLVVASRTVEIDALGFDEVTIDRGELMTTQELDGLDEPYRRFKVTESGISPRAVPGHANAVWVSTANEHDEYGAISEDAANRKTQVDKRARKMVGADQESPQPSWYGPEDAKTTFLCWGSTYGPLREAVDRMNAKQPDRANMLHFSGLFPLHAEATEAALKRTNRSIVVEGNSTGQFEMLLRSYTGFVPDAAIRRYDGRSFSPKYILDQLPQEV